MKNLQLLSLAIIAACIFSCESDKPNIDKMVDKFADLECRAMTLRETRFNLANQIRFTEDTLLHPTNKTDTSRLKLNLESFNKEKESTLKQSLSLADSIHTQLQLMKSGLTAQKDRAAFEEKLNNTLQQRGCLTK